MHHFRERNYFPALLPLAPCLYKHHSNQWPKRPLQLWDATADRPRASPGRAKGGAAGERGETQFAGTDGGMKQAEEGVAGAHHSQTRSRIPEGWGTAPAPLLPPPATRAVLPPWAMTSSSKIRYKDGKKENRRRKKHLQWSRGRLSVEEQKLALLSSLLFPIWGNLHRFQCWCCLLSSIAVNDTESGRYGSDGRSERRRSRRKEREGGKGKEEGRTQQSPSRCGTQRWHLCDGSSTEGWQVTETFATTKENGKKIKIKTAQGAFSLRGAPWAQIGLSSSFASVTALALSVLCIDVRGALSLQEQEPRSPTDEWCSAAVVMATAEQKEGEEKGGYWGRKENGIKKKRKERGRVLLKGHSFAICGCSFGDT